MPIAAAFTTTEAASLPVEAMDHLEHSSTHTRCDANNLHDKNKTTTIIMNDFTL